jgi:hypothetical protein
MNNEDFIRNLEEENRASVERLVMMSAAGEPPESLTIDRLLLVALKNELEASEIAAIWMPSTAELDVKLALARQAGDEARHYRLILERLTRMGVDVEGIDPRQGGYSPMFNYLTSLETTVARAAAGQFTREGIALARNQLFIELCESRDDTDTADLYRKTIQPDELHHHQAGRTFLARYATSIQQQREAREAARRTIELAEEIQEMARLKAGICRAPGC